MTIPRPADRHADAPVYVRDGCLDPRSCDAVRGAMDAAPQTPAEIFRRGYRVDETVRRSREVEADAETLALVQRAIEAQRSAIDRHFDLRLTGFEGVGLLRYLPHGFYLPHRDRLPASAAFAERRVSLVLFLGGHAPDEASLGPGMCAGGALRLFTGAAAEAHTDVFPAPGRLVVFSASLLHEVRPVLAGVRDVAVDWGY